MQTVLKEELMCLLEQDRASVVLQVQNGELSINPDVRIRIDVDSGQTKTRICGYVLTYPNGRIKKRRRIGGVLRLLKRVGIEKDALLVSVNGCYTTLTAFRRQKAIDKMDLAAIVAYYRPIADSFVLVSPYNEIGATGEVYAHISEADATLALQNQTKNTLDVLKQYYDGFSEEERQNLPDFEALVAEISAECYEHYKKVQERGGIDACLDADDSPFMCDHVGKDTKYSAPERAIWHFYHTLDMLNEYKSTLEVMQNSQVKRDICAELQNSRLAPLREHLISVTPTFCWHCTVTSMLHKEFRFRLNAQTEAWLLAQKSDFELEILEDLAFYRGDRLLFSSCAHEEFRSDYTTDDEEFD